MRGTKYSEKSLCKSYVDPSVYLLGMASLAAEVADGGLHIALSIAHFHIRGRPLFPPTWS